ncbi:hypothetical protein niasHT_026621 [Heterodera trifolii]|uniref:Glutathione synthetase n=1 Tax=Heterodera trifolii TaxID=157864 RepID=A0ABD2KSI1_9BILA
MKVFVLLICLLFITKAKSVEEKQPKDDEQDFDKENIQAIFEDAVDYAQALALVTLPHTHEGRGDEALIHPFTLFPTPFPRQLYEQAIELQWAYNLLYFRISNDFDFLIEHYEIAAKTNAHVRHYLNIMKEVKKEGIKQKKTLLLGRSDYMCHVVKDENTEEGERYELKQIEFNTGQLGGVHLARLLTQLHRRTMQKAGLEASKDQLLNNGSDFVIAEALFTAWTAFGDPKAVFLFVASRTSRNRFGQRHIEYLLEKISNYKMKVIRISLPACARQMKLGQLTLDPQDNILRLYGQKVAVTYIATEAPNPTDDEWEVRLLFERSTAIKSPTIGQDLANQKKVQQLLSKPGMLERFLPEPEHAAKVEALRRSFAGLWALHDEDEQTKRAIQDAIRNPQNYVIKPNREGGGHNIWGEDLKQKLLTFTKDERNAHILMEKLNPMVVHNYIVRPMPNDYKYGEMSTELSIIGYAFGNVDEMELKKNVQKGHFLRTKFANVNEGGVSFGNGAWDIPFLI